MLKHIAAVATLGILGVGSAPLGQSAGNGRIVGSVVFLGGQLPGTTVTVTGAGLTRTMIADNEGRFDSSDLPQGAYTMTGELPGFQTQTRQNVIVTPGRTSTVTLFLPLECAEYIDYISGTTPTVIQEADAVVHLRISESGPAKRWPFGESCLMGSEYTTTLIRILKSPPGQALPGSTMRIVLEGQPGRYLPGQEYVALLKWEDTGWFHPIAGATFMIPVSDGRVAWTRTDAPTLKDGMSVETFLSGVGALLSSSRPS